MKTWERYLLIVGILGVLLLAVWIPHVVGNALRWQNHGCGFSISKAIIYGEPRWDEYCRFG